MAVVRGAFARELSATLRFAVVIGAVVAGVSVAVFNVEARLTGVVTTTAAHVAVAGFMPAFFAAWLFFLMRRIAWASPLSAFGTATALAGAAFHIHGVVMGAHFHGGWPRWTLPLDWCERAVMGLLIPSWSTPTWDPTPVYALVAVGVGVAVAVLQRAVVQGGVRRAVVTPRNAP